MKPARDYTIEDLKEIAETCNERGIKTYLTVNTVIYGEDLDLGQVECLLQHIQ